MDRALIELDQVLCTPHLGASTGEAQLNVALEAVEQITDALLRGRVRNAINVPAADPAQAEALAPYATLARRLGSLQTQLAGRIPERLNITFAGDVAELGTQLVTAHALAGLLDPITEGDVNFINAPYLAEERGIQVTESKTSRSEDFTTLVSLAVAVGGEDHQVAGTLVGKGSPRIVRIDGYRVEAIPQGDLLVLFAEDKPGLIGNVGHVLGDLGINIAAMTFGRQSAGGDALTVLNLDGPADPRAVPAVAAAHPVRTVRLVRF